MNMDDATPLQQRIPAHWDGLSASERKLAHLLMQPGFSLTGFQAAELAALAEVSRACTARFFQKIGYEGFHQARRLERDLSGNSPLERTPAAGKPPAKGRRRAADAPRGAQAWQEHTRAQKEQLDDLHGAVGATQIDAAVGLLFKAPRVYVLGLRASHVLATYAQALWLQLRHDVHLLGDAAARPSELLSQVRPGDLLVAFDFRRRSSQLLPLMRAAARREARQLLVSDTAISDAVKLADASLCCPNPRHYLFDSHIAAFSLIHFVSTQIAARYPQQVRRRLADIEDLHNQLADIEGPRGAASTRT
ncbi:MurR/RpiR family transcriptional regulator [Verticiella sediminum]